MYVSLYRIVLFKRNVISYLISYEYKSFFNFKLVKIFHISLFHCTYCIYRSQYFHPCSASLRVPIVRWSYLCSRTRAKGRKVRSKMAITINRVLRCLGGAALKSRMSSGYERPFSLSLFARGVWREARGAWRATSCETHRLESGAPRGANLVRRERDQAGPNRFVVRAPMPDLSYCS